MNRRLSPAYLFGKAAATRLAGFIDRETLLAFDLDGTLAPIVPDPSAIGIPAAIRKAFVGLNARAPVAVITGRSRSDALRHLGMTPRYLIGNHGAEGLPGWQTRELDFVRAARGWQDQLEVLLAADQASGIDIENKGATLSIHYRHAINIPSAHEAIMNAVGQLTPKPRKISGKFVENLLPESAPDKGAALDLLLRYEDIPKAFFAGDDETDEQVFRLDDPNIFTVRVGRTDGSRARFYLRGQYEVARLLFLLNAILDDIRKEKAP